ncbi:unnamed protein product [Brachionus calyciflorus]|uniref:Uncharacterized protein n=1 Tax=Brachionus calyciflorus TaxID=104777 RepID=A0A813VXR9_9BILA|nr:unnamed protein product [Brachionus calyciflorus]
MNEQNEQDMTYDNVDSNSYLSHKLKQDLLHHFNTLNHKINIINNGYDFGRRAIEDKCQEIKEQINSAADKLINEIRRKQEIMLYDVECYKHEALLDYRERYEHNDKFEKHKKAINISYEIIMENLAHFNSKENKSDEDIRKLIESIELTNTRINDSNMWLIPNPNPSIGIIFSKNEQNIQIPFIGDLSYESVYKVDMVAKISYLNNSAQQRMMSVDHLFEKNLTAKYIGLISKNKILIVYEKIYGKVISIFAKIVYYNGMILHEIEFTKVGNLANFFIYENRILFDFRKCKNDHLLYLYDTNLKCLEDQALNYETEGLLMNGESVFIISKEKPYINEFDYRLNYKTSYGQRTKENKAFFVKDEVLAINDMKIYVKYENDIRLLSRTTGELLSKISFDELKTSKIYLDFHTEKYVSFNYFDKVSYHNHKGEMIKISFLVFIEASRFLNYTANRGVRDEGLLSFIGRDKDLNVLNVTCLANIFCDRKNTSGLICLDKKCLCPQNSIYTTGNYTQTTFNYCDIPYGGACSIYDSSLGVPGDRCRKTNNLICDPGILKCNCKSGTWNGYTCSL